MDFKEAKVRGDLLNMREQAIEAMKNEHRVNRRESSDHSQSYQDSVNRYLGSKREKKTLGDYWKISSFRKKFADALSVLGVVVICILFGLVALSACIRNRIEAGFIDKLFLAYGVIATWIPMRMYSDWHGSMGGTIGKNDGIVIAAILAVVMGILFFVFQRPTLKVGLTGAGLTLAATVIGGGSAFNKAWILPFIAAYHSAPPFVLMAIYIVIVIAFAALVMFVAEGGEEEELSGDP